MPLGTIDRTPPPFFRQGPTALTKLAFFAALALFCMVADSRFRITEPLRNGLAMALLPAQRVLAVPVDLASGGSVYVLGLQQAVADQRKASAALAAQAEKSARAEQLGAENARLRGLLELRPALAVRSMAAEVLYEAADLYSRKLVINIGSAAGVVRGAPVINEQGVLGQVTRVYPLTSELTLLADKDAAIPVLNTRTQQRGVAFGGAGGGSTAAATMELRFVSGNVDVQVADLLSTSGVDGIYPAGLAVAKVLAVDRRVDSSFARVLLVPAAAPDAVRHVLVLEPLSVQMPARPLPDATVPLKEERVLRGGRR